MGFVKWLGFKARFTHQENFSGFSTLRVFRFAAFTHTSQTEDIYSPWTHSVRYKFRIHMFLFCFHVFISDSHICV